MADPAQVGTAMKSTTELARVFSDLVASAFRQKIERVSSDLVASAFRLKIGRGTTDLVASAFRRKVVRVGGAVLMALLLASPALASERYALIISGAHGEPIYADQYAQWRQSTVTALLEKLAFDDTKILTLYEGGD